MALNTEVFTIEGWKRFISDSIAKLYAVTTALLDIYNRARSAGEKNFYEINDEVISKALISGLQDDGNYSQNALALFYRDALGIYLEDPKLLVRLYQSGRKLTVKVNISEEYFWRYIVNIQKISKFIIDRFGVSVSPAKIERPRDFYDKFLEFLNLIINLLPQYNQYTFLAFTLAQNTYKYLVEISKPENNIYPNILENKDLLNMLGITKIVEMPENEYSLWGYSDTMVFDERTNSVLGFKLDDVKSIGTLGGAMCRLIENVFAFLEHSHSTRLSEWFKNVPKDLEIEYVKLALESIRVNGLESPSEYVSDYERKLCDVDEVRSYLGNEIVMCTSECVYHDAVHCFTRRKGVGCSYYEVDDDYVVRKINYCESYKYYQRELKSRFVLWEYLDNYSPLTFLRVLNVVFIKPLRTFTVLIRPNLPTFTKLYNEVLGGMRGRD